MIIATPPAYLDAATFKAGLTGIPALLVANLSDVQIQNVLNGATGRADAIMCRSVLAREETRYYRGNGTATLDIDETPLLYVRSIAFAQPGLGSLSIPTQNLLIDYEGGELVTFTPLFLQGSGYVAHFPYGIELAVKIGFGYGRAVPQPTFSVVDSPSTGMTTLAPGSYDIAVVAGSFWGQTAAVPRTVASRSGGLLVTVQSVLGADRYRVFLAPTGQPLMLAAEIPATSFTSGPLAATVIANAPPPGEFAEPAPLTDSSAQPVPPAIVEATRILALDMLYEDANPANVGIARDGEMHYRRGEDSAAKTAGAMARAALLLSPFRYLNVL